MQNQSGRKNAGRQASSKRNDAKKTITQGSKNTKRAKNNNQNTKRRSNSKQATAAPVKITFLGGLNEIGKNITVYEYGSDMIVVDCGLAFPEQDMLGIDLVIPDFSYLKENVDRIRGVFITHGHEDHIGAIPYLLREVNVPVYGTRLTIGLIEGKLKEHNLLSSAKLNVIEAATR